MKKLLPILLLCSCSSAPTHPATSYSCHVFNLRGLYVHWWGQYIDEEDATKDAKTVNGLLIQAGIISDSPPLSECKCEPSN